MTTLLITGIGGDIAQGAARIVRLVRPHWRIVGVDIHERHGGALFADAVEVVPPVAANSYVDAMTRLVRRHGVDLCLPMSEAELGFIASRSLASFADAPFIGISAKAVDVGLDKLATARFLVEAGLPAPWTTEATLGTRPPSLPCIFKPRRSAGSKGVFICGSEQDAAFYAAHEVNGIFQELLLPADQEVTCAIYRARNGETAVLPMLRQLVGGFTGWARVVAEPDGVRQCTELARALDLRGPMNAQMRITAKGARIFEINPRLSSTVYLRHLLGFKDLEWMLDEFEGRKVVFPQVASGMVAVRTQDAAVLTQKGC